MKTKQTKALPPPFAAEKRKIAKWLAKHGMTLADVGVDHPAKVSDLNDPDVILSLLNDTETES